MKRRLLVNSLIAIALFTLPWWFSVFFCLLGLFLFKNFWEIIVWAFVLDIFYGIHGGLHDNFFWATLAALIIFIVSIPIRKRISI